MNPADWEAGANLLVVGGTVVTAAIALSGWGRSLSRDGRLERLSAAADRDWNIWRNLPLFHKARAQLRARADAALQAYLREAKESRAVRTRADRWSLNLYAAALSLMVVGVLWALLRYQADDFAVWEALAIVLLISLGFVLSIAGAVVEAVALRRKRRSDASDDQRSGKGNA